ncbi:hypothetical protein ACFWM1_28450 [Nocardia sp. NPDC058379]|uniref:hypothetical protein n=1 Tax=unclassified Nocardia TaxID=2637762 RepID=UPI0036474F49
MALTPDTICAIRECTNPATHLYEFTFQNQPRSQARCEPHYAGARHVAENFDRWLDHHLDR